MIAKLEIENFLSIENIKIKNMNKMDTIGISGQYKEHNEYSNGSGKSSLAETILYAFTGKHRYKKDIDIVRIGEQKAHILLEYKNKETITIERFIKIKKNKTGTLTTCLIKQNDETVASGTTESQNWINNYFDMTQDGFIKSFFFRQKEYDQLLKARPGERLKFIEEFLGASIFDKAKKLSAKRRNELNLEIKGIDVQIQTLNEKIELNDNITEIKKDLKGQKLQSKGKKELLIKKELLKEQKTKEITREEEKLKNLKKSFEERDKVKLQLEEIKPEGIKLKKNKKSMENSIIKTKNNIKNFKMELSKIDKFKDKDSKENKLDTLENKRENLLVEIATYKAKLEFAEENNNKISVGDCPLCNRQINESLMDTLKGSNEKKIRIANKCIESEEGAIESIDFQILQLNDSLNKIRKDEKTRKEFEHKITIQETELKGNTSMLKAFNDQIITLANQFASLKKTYETLKNLKENNLIKILEEEYNTIIKSIEYLKDSHEVCNEAINKLQIQINTIMETKKNISLMDAKRKFRAKEIKCRIKLDSVFDKCRMEIISVGLKELEDDSTNIISDIGATQKEIVWKTQRESLKGNLKDSLDIYLVDEKGSRLIEGLSGGEWDVTAFSTRAALARYKSSRMNSRINFMVLDEVFGALDEGSKEELITIINMFKEEFSQVFIISHTDLKENFGYNIKVEMGSDGITRLI